MTGLFVIFVKDYQNGRIMEDCNRYIRFDWAAKRMLRDKANFSVLEGLISVLLNQDVKIQEILESEGNQEQEDSKFNRVDIMAKNHKGELVIIEIQLSRQVHYLERIFFGVGKALSDHITKGDSYKKVKKVYSISILYFDLGQGEDYVYHGQTVFRGIHTGDIFQLSERDREILKMRSPKEVFPEYYLIRVNEFDKVASTPLEEWIDYLKNGHVRPDTTTPGLKEAKEKLNYLRMSPEERRAYEHYLDNLRIEEDCLESAKLEGRAEGEAKGRAEGEAKGRAEGEAAGFAKAKIEMARNLKSMGISTDVIIKTTGFSPEEINQL